MTLSKSLAFLAILLSPQLLWASNDAFREDVIHACNTLMNPDVNPQEVEEAQSRIAKIATINASPYAILFLWNLNARPENRCDFVINFLAEARNPVALRHLGKLLIQADLAQSGYIQSIRDSAQQDEESEFVLQRLQTSLNSANEIRY